MRTGDASKPVFESNAAHHLREDPQNQVTNPLYSNQKKCYLIEENEDHVEREQPNHHYLESINELQELCMEMRENTTKVGELGSTHD